MNELTTKDKKIPELTKDFTTEELDELIEYIKSIKEKIQ